jgi:nitrite reductase (NADH) large subunit
MTQADAWKCDVCGYVHRGPGAPEHCPVCGVGREMFSPFVVAEAPRAAAPSARWRCTVCEHVHEGTAPPAQCPVCGAEAGLFEALPTAEAALATSSEPRRLVVLGAGVAGLTAVEEARRRAPRADITLVSKEDGLPYFRLNLTRLLADEVAARDLQMQPAAWFAEQRVGLVHDTAASIDRQKRQVQLESGRTLDYDRLVIATGAHPFVPPLVGATRKGVSALRTHADVQALLEHGKPGGRAVCLGGGVLGLETAGALQRRGMAVTVLEGFDWLLPRQLAEPAGRMLQREVERLGITVRCGARTEELLGDEEVRAVRLAGGEEIPANLVVLATGVRPNSYLGRLCGLEVGRGIVVDDHMATSDPLVLAAGDVAEHRGVVYGLWPHAFAQGLVAGANAAGTPLEFRGLPPSNRLKVLGIELFSIGQFLPLDASYLVLEQQDKRAYLRLVAHDGRLVGANLFGDTAMAGSLKTWVEAGTQLAEIGEIATRFPDLRATTPSNS